jgi:hypothetical protein
MWWQSPPKTNIFEPNITAECPSLALGLLPYIFVGFLRDLSLIVLLRGLSREILKVSPVSSLFLAFYSWILRYLSKTDWSASLIKYESFIILEVGSYSKSLLFKTLFGLYLTLYICFLS